MSRGHYSHSVRGLQAARKLKNDAIYNSIISRSYDIYREQNHKVFSPISQEQVLALIKALIEEFSK
jgi:hypothetical protein